MILGNMKSIELPKCYIDNEFFVPILKVQRNIWNTKSDVHYAHIDSEYKINECQEMVLV